MRKFVCSICGYAFDEAVGDPKWGIAAGTKWDDVPEHWSCPLCGAPKADFEEVQVSHQASVQELRSIEHDTEAMKELSFGELSALCSNLSKGCEKQYQVEEAELFNQLAEYYKSKHDLQEGSQLKDIGVLIENNLSSDYPKGNVIAADAIDRGALRALVWGEKVTKILNSLLSRYEKKQDALIENTHVYVCEICGFVYIGDKVPEVCPVCKVPNVKIIEIKRGR